MPTRGKTTYYYPLNGLRGLAAIIIAIYHSLFILKVDGIRNIFEFRFDTHVGHQAFITQILLLFFNGNAAITIFFILSGFVLGISLGKHTINIKRYFIFILKRILRLFPVLIISLIFASFYLVYFHQYKSYDSATIWFLQWFRFKLTKGIVIDDLFLQSSYLNSNAWTLNIEFLGSILAPVLFKIKKDSTHTVDIVFIICFIILGFIFKFNEAPHYIYMFYLGMIIPNWKNLFGNSLIPLFSISLILISRIFFVPYAYLGELLVSLMIFLLIGSLIYGKNNIITDFLNTKIAQFYGRISYSFFLIHFLILYVEAKFILDNFPQMIDLQYAVVTNLFIGAISIISSTIIENCIYRFIEKPIIKFGYLVEGIFGKN